MRRKGGPRRPRKGDVPSGGEAFVVIEGVHQIVLGGGWRNRKEEQSRSPGGSSTIEAPKTQETNDQDPLIKRTLQGFTSSWSSSQPLQDFPGACTISTGGQHLCALRLGRHGAAEPVGRTSFAQQAGFFWQAKTHNTHTHTSYPLDDSDEFFHDFSVGPI